METEIEWLRQDIAAWCRRWSDAKNDYKLAMECRRQIAKLQRQVDDLSNAK